MATAPAITERRVIGSDITDLRLVAGLSGNAPSVFSKGPAETACKRRAGIPCFVDKIFFYRFSAIRLYSAALAAPYRRSQHGSAMGMTTKAAARRTSAKALSIRDTAREPAGSTLTERTLERLREDIVAGKFAATERLRVQELSARYGVGASPLREALAHLAADGLVATVSNRGFRVAPMSVADFMDVAENRVRIECLALERSIAAGDDEWEARLVADYHRLRKFEATHSAQSQLNDPEFEWERRHRQFHHALIAACPSQWLLHFDRLLVLQFDRYRRLVMLKAGTTKNGRQQEEALVEATLARKTAKAIQILRAHIDDWATTILEQLENRLAG